MKLYKGLCIFGAVTMLAMITALVISLINRPAGIAAAAAAFVCAAVFTVILIVTVIKHLSNNKRK